MKKILFALAVLASSLVVNSQNIEFFDDFESGTGNWTFTGTWGLTTNSFTGIYAMTESPVGNYPNQTTMIATMDTLIDLSLALDAQVLFAGTFSIEYGFDFMYLEASSNGGATWVTIDTFHGDSIWWKYTYSLGGFVGSSNVKCRFRFVSDDMLNFDGMSIDDFMIMSYTQDNTPPLIVHSPLPHYEGSLYAHQVVANIVDISGVNFAALSYRVDNVLQPAIFGFNYSGNNWLFEIPPLGPGAWVEYTITAQDLSTNLNQATSDTFKYIAGNYIKYDNGVVDFVGTVSPFSTFETGAAVKINLNGTTHLVAALIRNYVDFNNPNADMEFHVWAADSAGNPGVDLITPFYVTPAANAAQPHRMTRIDLRSYSNLLTGISGDIFVGFKAPLGEVHVVQTTPSVGHHTYIQSYGAWNLDSDDYHFRAVTSAISGAPVSNFSFNPINDPVVSFTDLSLNNPVAWYWDFDDAGAFSSAQNPNHTFTLNGTYNVCLTADNGITTHTSCQFVTVQNVQAPVAGFSYITTYSPQILFVDSSLNYPLTWYWDFDDNGATWNYLNPMYTFSHNDTFHVCLTVQNNLGSNMFCQDIIIDDYTAPEAAFSYNLSASPWIQFYDESSSQIINAPDNWYWEFDDNGTSSIATNPLHLFSANGVYNVCLTVNNQYGADQYCGQVFIDSYVAPTAGFSYTLNGPVVQFTNQSTDSLINAATSWYWDFGDGTASSNMPSPQHTFPQNGIFNVCLTASNTEGSDTICQPVEITAYEIPIAGFSMNVIPQPVVFFVDQSTGYPQSYFWDFDDLMTTSAEKNPAYTFSTNDTFNVCLTVINYLGSDTLCQPVIITSHLPPVSNFSFQIEEDTIVHFIDLTTNMPTSWLWNFDFIGQTSTDQHPTMVYPISGDYNVCLTTSNSVGTSAAHCQLVSIVLTGNEIVSGNQLVTIYPQPMQDKVYIEIPYQDENQYQLYLYNLLGEQVEVKTSRQENKIVVYRNSLAPGIYLIDIHDKSGSFFKGKILME